MIDYFDLCKKCYSHYYCQCYYYHRKKNSYVFPGNIHREFHEKIIKPYFNIEYIKILYLLQKKIKLNKNIYNINVLIDIFMNLYDNSNIDCNKKIKINYMIYIIILFLINSFIVIVNKVKFIINTLYDKVECKARRSLVFLRSKELVFFVYC